MFFIAYSYVVYPLILFILVKFKKRTAAGKSTENLPFVSVIISAYNEEIVLPEKLANLRAIDYPTDRIEFIIGSDGSTDKTDQILRDHEGLQVRSFIFDRREGKGCVLNKIVPHAKGDILVFSDANTLYMPDTVANLVSRFSSPKVGGVCGELTLQSNSKTHTSAGEASYWAYENILKQLESRFRTIIGATGGVYAIRKELYCALPIGRAVADDLFIPLQVVMNGYDVKYEPSAKAYERSTDSISKEYRRKVRIGTQILVTVGEVRSLLHPRFGFVSFALWSHKMIRWFIPFLMVAFFVADLVLMSSSQFFTRFFVLECVFLFAASAGWFSEKMGIRIGIGIMPYYFLAMNTALLVGILRAGMGHRLLMWDTIR